MREAGVISITDMTCRTAQHGRSACAAMSTIDNVRAAEKKMHEILDALKNAQPQDLDRLQAELRFVSDEHAKAIRELEW